MPSLRSIILDNRFAAPLGLFGKLKIRIYVDEHEAGNAELGRVASGYRVK